MFPNDNEFVNIIPMHISADTESLEVSDFIINAYQKYGFDTFMLLAPTATVRAYGFSTVEDYEKAAEYFNEVKANVKPYGISLGWWWQATVKAGHSDEFPSIVRSDGSEVYYSPDPLNKDYRKAIAVRVARFAELAHPDFIFTEDDYSMFASSGEGCFCEKHLDEFRKYVGKRYQREELCKILTESTDDAVLIKKEWHKLLCDTLVYLAEDIRKELDIKTPEIPMGLMQTGHADRDGEMTDAVSRALAGKRHRPFCRFFGVDYGGMRTDEIPDHIFHPLYDREHLGEDYIFIHESDPYPQTRFFTSANQMKVIMSLVYSYGYTGSVYNVPHPSNGLWIEDSYFKTINAVRGKFKTLMGYLKDCKLNGVHLHYDRFVNSSLINYQNPNPLWLRTLSLSGIPYTSREDSKVWFVDWRQAKFFTDDEIVKLLSGSAVIDGEAAKILIERGYSDYLGVEIDGLPTDDGSLKFDFGATEVISKEVLPDIKQRRIDISYAWAPKGNGIQYRLRLKGAEAVTVVIDSKGKSHGAAMTRYINKQGGRIVVMGETLENNHSQSLFNYGRSNVLKKMIEWCGGEIITTSDTAKIHIIENRPKSTSDFKSVITLVNLGEDDGDGITLNIPSSISFEKVLSIGEDGGLHPISFRREEKKLLLDIPLNPFDPEFIILS